MSEIERPLIGWCAEHESCCEVYDDGSVSCMYLLVVESWSNDCRPVAVPPELRYRPRVRVWK